MTRRSRVTVITSRALILSAEKYQTQASATWKCRERPNNAIRTSVNRCANTRYVQNVIHATRNDSAAITENTWTSEHLAGMSERSLQDFDSSACTRVSSIRRCIPPTGKILSKMTNSFSYFPLDGVSPSWKKLVQKPRDTSLPLESISLTRSRSTAVDCGRNVAREMTLRRRYRR